MALNISKTSDAKINPILPAHPINSITAFDPLDGVGESMETVLEETGLSRLYAAIQKGSVFNLPKADSHNTSQIYECDERHTILLVPANAEYTIINKIARDIIFIVDESATMHYHTALNVKNSGGSAKSFIYLLKDAKVDWIDASITDGVRNEHIVYLSQEGANAKYRSMFLLEKQEHHDSSIFMIHAASNTKSTMLTRSVLLDSSRASYQGTIKILPNAFGCTATQHEDTLLLGEHAHMDAVPILEIENDEVQCSHGVTIGTLSEEQIFYLQARGIPIEDAKRMLILGFFDRILISMGDLGRSIREEYAKRLNG